MLAELGFSEPIHVEGRASIADLFKPDKRCGIYVLHFADGAFYVGQAGDVTRRFVQHRKTHTDIEKIAFRQVPRADLNDAERDAIWRLERSGWPLRNIALTSIPTGESDFDLIMPQEEQERWLNDEDYVDLQRERVVDPTLRMKYSRRYQRRFKQMPHSDPVIAVLRQYVRVGIPAIHRGEISFWACSCLPAHDIYARININWQEVLTAGQVDGQLHFAFHLALSPLPFGKALAELFEIHPGFYLTADDMELDGEPMTDEEIAALSSEDTESENDRAFNSTVPPLFQRFPSLLIEDHSYAPGGQDQVCLHVVTADETLKLLQLPEIQQAIRVFNLRLMRRGPSNGGQNHCLDLADDILSGY